MTENDVVRHEIVILVRERKTLLFQETFKLIGRSVVKRKRLSRRFENECRYRSFDLFETLHEIENYPRRVERPYRIGYAEHIVLRRTYLAAELYVVKFRALPKLREAGNIFVDDALRIARAREITDENLHLLSLMNALKFSSSP